MSWTDDVELDISLPNGEVWRITYYWASKAIAGAKYNIESHDFIEERGYYLRNPDEIVYDLQGHVDWDVITKYGELIEQSDDVDYHDQWMRADVTISKDERDTDE